LSIPGSSISFRLRVVLDTNVYVSATILSRGTPFSILDAWRRREFVLVTSESIIEEIERVLRYPRIRDRYTVTEQDVARLVASLRSDALVVSGAVKISGISRDSTDDKFLACAVEAQADCIVTGDPDLLVLGRYHGVDILKPHEFLQRLRSWRVNES
jgi:putative PIN family toxin of toxin-antitoxin system